MIGAPLALLGLLAVVVPVIIHLFGRQQARVLRFPTLRFVATKVVPPTTRRRITDLPLLIVRCLIVALAAFALARPRFVCRPEHSEGPLSGIGILRCAQDDRNNARVVIVDTSTSIGHTEEELAGVRRTGDSLAKEVATAKIIQTDDPASMIPAAAEWLEKVGGRSELVVISDFTQSAIDSIDFAAVPREIGIRLVPHEGGPVYPWDPRQPKVRVFASPLAVKAMNQNSDVFGTFSTTDSANASTFIFSDYPGRDAIVAHPLGKSPVLARTIERILRDSVVRAAAVPVDRRLPPGVQPVLYWAIGVSAEGIWVNDSATSTLGAAVMSMMNRGRNEDAREFDDRETPPAVRPVRNDDSSDGRYIWIAVLLLLGFEAWMRARHPERGEGSTLRSNDIGSERAA
jgi:hypothetical protein